jgi:hypothetical protein
MLLLGLIPGLWPFLPGPQLTTLVSSYTPGEQLSLEVTPDGTRGFLAMGATIGMMDLTGTTPVQYDKYQIPFYQPLAMRYYHQVDPDTDYLFVAGGALGVCRITLPLGLPAQASSYTTLGVEGAVGGGVGGFQRKRCVDVDVLQTANGPVLFALFAASSSSADSPSPTELRAYTWDAFQATKIATIVFDSTTSPDPAQVGTALAVDPADNSGIYVAMGKGGIWRVALAGATLTKTQIWTSLTCPIIGSPQPQHVRDIAIVHLTAAPIKSVLYAALNYKELLEIGDLSQPGNCNLNYTTRIQLSSPPDNGYAENVTALVNQGNKVRVALVSNVKAGKMLDDRAPDNINGIWSDVCLSTIVPDLNAPPFPVTAARVWIFTHDFASGALTYATNVGYPGFGDIGPNTAIFKETPAGADRLWLSARVTGMEVYDFAPPTNVLTKIGQTFVGEAFATGDCTVSTINPGFVRIQGELGGAVLAPIRQMAYIDPAPPYGISTILDTQSSPCRNPNYDTCSSQFSGEPGLYAGNIMEEAHWAEPGTGREYFLPPRRLWDRVNKSTASAPLVPCDPIIDCSGPLQPCDAANNTTWNLIKVSSVGPPAAAAYTAWGLTSLQIPTGIPIDGPSLSGKWWQLETPFPGGAPPTIDDTAVEDRAQSIADTRLTTGVPNAVYLTKSGSAYGTRCFRPSFMVGEAAARCSGGQNGHGERLPLTYADVRIALTHLEREFNSCIPISPCLVQPTPPLYAGGPHQLVNDRTDLYKTKDGSGADMYVLAIASGFVASHPGTTSWLTGGASTPQNHPGCDLWTTYAGRSMLALVDVTSTGGGVFGQPVTRRLAIGNGEGHAYCVRVKTTTNRSWAYVGDVMGKVMVFDVTGSRLFPTTSPYLPTTPFLYPSMEIALPRDPVDGMATNCLDMEIIGDYLYCALGRQGIGVVRIVTPSQPELIAVIDTPGEVLGLAQRTVPGGTQLIVCDAHCGLRIYQ